MRNLFLIVAATKSKSLRHHFIFYEPCVQAIILPELEVIDYFQQEAHL